MDYRYGVKEFDAQHDQDLEILIEQYNHVYDYQPSWSSNPVPTIYDPTDPRPFIHTPSLAPPSTTSADTAALHVFCDIDGVLADNSRRMHYIEKVPKNYDNSMMTLKSCKMALFS